MILAAKPVSISLLSGKGNWMRIAWQGKVKLAPCGQGTKVLGIVQGGGVG